MFIKEPITSRIAIIFIILSVSFVPSQYLGFFTVNAQLNSTAVVDNQTAVSQTESNPITPFTIPRDDVSQSNGLQSTSTGAGSNNSNLTQPLNDLVLLSQRYNDERFGDEIVGEILNNGTITAEYAKVSASFYDRNGAILGSEFTYADPSTLDPGQKSAFTIFITSDTIEDDTETYEFTLQWQDNDFNDFSKRITGEQAQAVENNNDDDNDDKGRSNDNDNDVDIGGDLNCSDIGSRNFQVGSNDPNNFDGDGDGVGCESSSNNNDNDNQNAISSDSGSRCPDGSHRSPDGDCERVSDSNDNDDNNNNDNDDNGSSNDNDDNNNNDNDDNGSSNDNDDNGVEDNVRDSVRDSGIDFSFD